MTALPRRRLLSLAGATAAVAAASLAAPACAIGAPGLGIDYLEALGTAGGLPAGTPYLPPSRLHPAYRHAFYVNTAFSGAGMQKMWALERDAAGWRLSMHDPAFWERQGGTPAFSWPVSTGTDWPGNPRAGQTPVGVFNPDERRFRDGWGSPGMYRAVYIDLHYSGGRISGVAMHGTPAAQYPHLGRPASHGCVRLHQDNMDRVWSLLHPGGRQDRTAPVWGTVPRYFTSAPTASLSGRSGYVRDGRLLHDAGGALLTREGYRAVFVFFRDDL